MNSYADHNQRLQKLCFPLHQNHCQSVLQPEPSSHDRCCAHVVAVISSFATPMLSGSYHLLTQDAFGSERRKAKMLNFSIAYGKTAIGLSRDWKVSVEEAQETVNLWYNDRQEVRKWQELRKKEAIKIGYVLTLLGRARKFPVHRSRAQKNHIERAAINTPVQGSAADVAMCAMLEISTNQRLKELGWKLLLQVHDEVILEGPSESAEIAKDIVVNCMCKPFNGKNILSVDLCVDAKCAQSWYAAK